MYEFQPNLSRAEYKLFIILFFHEATEANSARSIYLKGKGYDTAIPNCKNI